MAAQDRGPSAGQASPLGVGSDGQLLLRLKVVPGASTSAIVGPMGDRLKVRVAAPAEEGAANQAVLALLAARLRLSPRSVTLIHGASAPLKTVCVQGLARADVARLLEIP